MKFDKIKIRKKSMILRINLIALFIALLVIFKWTLGFFPGFEVLTFFIIFFSLFMYFFDLLLITWIFSLFVGLIYGFNMWIVPYFFILPTQAILTWWCKKWISKHILWLALWSFFLALFWTPTYFVYDWIIYGRISAISAIITSIPTSLIGGLLNFGVMLVVGPFLSSLFIHTLKRPYNLKYLNNLNILKHNKIWLSTFSLISVGGIIGVEITAVHILEFGDMYRRKQAYQYEVGFLTEKEYNQIQSELKDNQCEIVVIYGGLTYSTSIENCTNKLVSDVIFSKEGFVDNNLIRSTNPNLMSIEHKFWIYKNEENSGGIYGDAIGKTVVTYKNQQQPLSIDSECPFLHIKRVLMTGASQTTLQSRDVIQLSYDAKGTDGRNCQF